MHGRSGTFLASLAALSLLSITSHHRGYHSHNSIKIHNSDVLARHTPSPPDQRVLVFPHGTRVTVRDLFGSMPVRVKQRAHSAADKTTTSRDYVLLKHAVTSLLLAWPAGVRVSLRDPWTHQSSAIRSSQAPEAGAPENEQRAYAASHVCRVLCQAGLSDESSVDSWVAIKASAGNLRLSGAACLVPGATKRAQFISIGVLPVLNERGSNILYEEINRLFANSSFGVEEEASEINDAERTRRAEDRRYKSDGYTGRELRTKKSIDRWPVFYLNIDIHGQDGTVCDVDQALDERRQTLTAIINTLQATVYELLRKHHFRPKFARPIKASGASLFQKQSGEQGARPPRDKSPALFTASSSQTNRRKRSIADVESQDRTNVADLATTRLRLSSNATSRSRADSPFTTWTRVKSGRSGPEVIDLTSPDGRKVPTPELSEVDPSPLCDATGNLLRMPFIDCDMPSAADVQISTEFTKRTQRKDVGEDDGDYLTWVNPVTRKKSLVSRHTGFVIFPHGGEACQAQASRPISNRVSAGEQSQMQEPQETKDVSPWLQDLLSNWKNPVFAAVEAPIPVATNVDRLSRSGSLAIEAGCCGWQNANPNGGPGLASITGRVSRDALRNAEVIAQVDRKFIFARVPLHTGHGPSSGPHSATPSLLIMIDQHAADERCLVEALMRSYFATKDPNNAMGPRAQTVFLDRPLQFEISAQEHTLFERHSSEFRHWGIAYEVPPLTIPRTGVPGSGRTHPLFLRVLSLPPSISERCRVEPRLLIDLLRKEVWEFEERGHFRGGRDFAKPQSPRKTEKMDKQWLSRLHGCPQGIQDMMNSRACRSAIMFNDVLPLKDCKDLLRRLADCAFPFQCAHGRPAIVPLVDLGDSDHLTTHTAEVKHRECFGKQFKRWRAAKRDSREQ